MRTLEVAELPDEVYEQLEKLARVRGSSVADVAADLLTKAFKGEDEAEARLMADLRADRTEMARRGVWVTQEQVEDAINRGRP
jgi:plasmid stability protein